VKSLFELNAIRRKTESRPETRFLLKVQHGSSATELEGGLEFGGAGLFFDHHVFEFTGIEDFPAFFALYKFRVFLARNDAHTRMLADLFHADSLGWKFGRCGLGGAHSPVILGPVRVILALVGAMSTPNFGQHITMRVTE
jgi:hypothetical protein